MKRWPLHRAYFWETAPFFRLVMPLAMGIFSYDRGWLRFVSGSVSLMVAGTAFLLFLLLAIFGKVSGAYRIATFCALTMIMYSVGFSVSWYDDIRNDKQWFGDNLDRGSVYFAGINDAPIEKERSWKVPVTIVSAIKGGNVSPVKGNALIYLYKDNLPAPPHKGDSILVPGKWQPIKNAGNPFEFDYAKYCGQNNLYYQQSCSVNDIRLYAAFDKRGTSYTDRAHDWGMDQLDRYIAEPRTRGLVQAMLLGDEVNLDEDLRQSYADTGVVHIIAISGGNVAIFFMAISFLLWRLKHRKHLWIKYAIALPLVWFYVIMAGAAPSAIRAAIMFSLLAFSVMLQKDNNSLNTLFATAFLLLCAQPMWLFSLGFQLSFAAVLSIILFYKPIYSWLTPKYKILRGLWATVAASISAELLVAPLVIYYFHIFPLLFIIANVAAYIFMSVVLILSMAIIAMSWIPIIATGIGIVTVWLVTVFDKFVSFLQGLNPESFHFLVLSTVELMLIYTAISGVLLFLVKKKRQALFTSLIAACLVLISFCHNEWLRLHQYRFIVYNTGKADRIELIKGGSFAIINSDTGSQEKTGFVVRPAHTNWQAWKNDIASPGEIFDIGGKTVLLLNGEINSTSQFPVDYLVVNYTAQPDLSRLQKIFSPSAIIIGNNYSRKEQDRIIKDFGNKGINIYSVSEKGAFVMN